LQLHDCTKVSILSSRQQQLMKMLLPARHAKVTSIPGRKETTISW
jgi:hypothetical protein